MKYYSEKTGKLYSSVEALQEAESTFDAQNLNSAPSKKRTTKKACNVSETVNQPTRKQLAADVEQAEGVVKAAYAEYDVAKQKVEELSKQYLEQVDAIIEPAKENVKKAEQARYDAIRKFNEAYGAYQTVYTGDRAAAEFSKALKEMNNLRWFKDLFFI